MSNPWVVIPDAKNPPQRHLVEFVFQPMLCAVVEHLPHVRTLIDGESAMERRDILKLGFENE